MISAVRARWSRAPAAGLALAMLTLAGGPTAAASAPVPAGFTIHGSGAGHGVGMSQWGAKGMALHGYPASRIIAHYYPGTATRPAKLPATISVGLLQAGLDPGSGGRLGRVLVKGRPLGGARGSGTIVLSGRDGAGHARRRYLPGGVTWTIRPEGHGMSVFGPHGRVFGPAMLDGHGGLVVRYGAGAGVRVPGLLALPQARRTLRWGMLEVRAVRDERGVVRPRAVLRIGLEAYLRGLGEMPASWPATALRAQAIAARSYAAVAVANRGQHRDRALWSGCDCAIYPDTRDQFYLGWAQEGGSGGSRWVAAVTGTRSLAVRTGTRLVQAVFSTSSGGMTQSGTVWGGPPLRYLPVQADPWDCARVNRRCTNPDWRWTELRPAAAVTAALAKLGVGTVTGIRVTSRDRSGRARAALVTGTRGRATTSGGVLQRLLGLKSTRFGISPVRA